MNLFIDTNILLSFYHFTSNDLEELKKLGILIRQNRVSLLVTDQVQKELRRNRGTKIADALRQMEQQPVNLKLPQFCKDYGEYKTLSSHQRELKETFAKLVERVREDAVQEKLKADVIINELFELAQVIPIDAEIVERARFRSATGNPPGKVGSLGDAINWEALLLRVPIGQPLFFVSADSDYCSPLDTALFDPFLVDEWSRSKKSELVFHSELSSFFREHFPHINLNDEVQAEKDLLIRDLAVSGCFANTHSVVEKLRKHMKFSSDQLNEIVAAVINNDQVHLIIRDPDINAFVLGLITGREIEIDPSNLDQIRKLLGITDKGEDVPF